MGTTDRLNHAPIRQMLYAGMFRKGFAELRCYAARNLRNLQRVREACAIEVTIAQVQDLRLPLEPAETG
jgi:hypothetical protein